MRKDIIAMSQKERQRYHLLKMVIGGKITLKETDNLMGVSYRHAKRLKKKLISEGAKGLSMAIEEDHLPRPSAVSLLKRYLIFPSPRTLTSMILILLKNWGKKKVSS